MKKAKFFFPVLMLFFAFGLQAQVKLGAAAGVALTKWNMPLMEDLGILKLERGTGVTAGIQGTFPVYGPVSVRAEANYTVRNYRATIDPKDFTDYDLPLTLTAGLHNRYFEFPVLLQIDVGQGPVGGYLLGGGAVAIYDKSRLGIGVLGQQLVSIPVNVGLKEQDFSAIAGAGLRIEAGPVDFLVEGRYELGLTNLINAPVVSGLNIVPKNRNNALVFKAGIAVPLSGAKRNRRIAGL